MSGESRAGRGGAVVASLAGGGALFAISATPWFSVPVTPLVGGVSTIGVSGAQAVPALSGVALVLLAAGAAFGIVGRAGRRVVGALVVLAGVVAAWLVTAALRAPASAVRGAVAEHTGVGSVPDLVSTSPWPFVTLVLVAVVLALGARHTLGLGPWPQPGARVRHGADRPVGLQGEGAVDDPTGIWDALSDGDDPTAPGRIP